MTVSIVGCHSVLLALVFLANFRMGSNIITIAIQRITAEIGRVTNIVRLPFDSSKDWRKAFSIIGPKTNVSASGAMLKPVFLAR